MAASNTPPGSTGQREGTMARSSMRESRKQAVGSVASSVYIHARATERSRTNGISTCAPPRRYGAPTPSEAVGFLELSESVDRAPHLGGIGLPERNKLGYRTAVPGDDEAFARLNAP